MQKIPLSKALPGMILARPVLRDNGLVLIAEGTELSENLIERLSRMQIESVVVKGEVLNLNGAAGGTPYEHVIGRLDHLFRKHANDRTMIRLKEMLRQYFTIKAAAMAPPEEPKQ